MKPLFLSLLLLVGSRLLVSADAMGVCPADNTLSNVAAVDYNRTKRPLSADRLFVSPAVDREIQRVKSLLTNPKLAWMFENCFPNTLDTTVHFSESDDSGKPDTFVVTGDIDAMWLRDSAAQVWPYLALCADDPRLKKMIEGVIRRQFRSIVLDPYANAFNFGPTGSQWATDKTNMSPWVHERKWEIDSLCYPIRLAYEYWRRTGDDSIFDDQWLKAINNIVETLVEQQRKDGTTPYTFLRVTDRAFDTLSNNGLGAPVKPCGLVVSSFRPSDDATTLQYLVPSNFFAVSSLRKSAEILSTVNKDMALAGRCNALADEIESALNKYATYEHPEFGTIYAFEVDGFGNHLLMDDANVPSLLAMAYLGDVDIDDPVYQNTRRFVWSESNPYFFKGEAGEGIGGPHVGYGMAWPMSIMMHAFTSTDDEEIARDINMLLATDADTGYIHESFDVNNPANYTRDWFAWQNTLFGELILKLIADGKLDLLNNLR
ncbi:MAG: glycoside hydrolase family 125 protein [Bacteroides sp.]|nr:glycoside hydrolase family 125 protein [Bacteroides sp.]MCM1413090.1 glycoside hydrolase family 125 protein [Bacteroides sp.]MCM1472168.1 glycoside hydrolase family 125 protein [Bacteroides sp.]